MWDNFISTTNVNTAYDIFLSEFMKKYDKHCPVRRINRKHVNCEKLWFTPDLKCLSQEKLLVKNRSNETEYRLKKINNKPSTILRNAEKHTMKDC